MGWQTSKRGDGRLSRTAIMDNDDKVVVGHVDPQTAEYIATACNIYESLINNYLAIADDLAQKEGLELLFPPEMQNQA